MTGGQAVPHDAHALARRFIDAFNDRDLDALRELISDDVDLRTPRGDALRGHDGARALIAFARDLDLRLVPLGRGSAERRGGNLRMRMPVRELVGPDDIERVAEFEIRDGRVTAFSLRPAA